MTQLDHTRDAPAATCPVDSLGAEYLPFAHEGMYQLFERARAGEPVFYSPAINYWVLTRREDVLQAFRDTERFSASIAMAPVTPLHPDVIRQLAEGGFTVEATQVSADPPKHTRIRAVAARLLSSRRFAALEPDIRRLVVRAADRLVGRARVDLIGDFAYDLPALIVFLLLGVEDADVSLLKRWSDKRMLLTMGDLGPAAQQEAAAEMLDYWHYCRALVAERMDTPAGEDYVTQLIAARDGNDDVLTVNEIASLVFGLLLAGHETTTTMTGNALEALLTHPDAWAAICADPSLIPNAVEEALRHASSVVCWRRRALVDVTLSGVTIPAGANLLLAIASANHDESRFPDPARFDIHRSNARQHVSFGSGIHFCLGAPLARMELVMILEELTRRFPALQLEPDQELEMSRTITFRGPRHLWARTA